MAGEDIMVISERLGHSSIKITMAVYLHSNAGHHRAAGDRIGALFETPSEVMGQNQSGESG
jgi:integrase